MDEPAIAALADLALITAPDPYPDGYGYSIQLDGVKSAAVAEAVNDRLARLGCDKIRVLPNGFQPLE